MIMNKYLPRLEDLVPISDSTETFSETPMVREFSKLYVKEQLQVLADLVRQSMIYMKYPNPNNDRDILMGDDFTSSKVFLDYIHDLNLFPKSHLALVNSRKNIDLKNSSLYHFVVIVEASNNKTFMVDTTPDVGYTYGKVIDLEHQDIYQSYTVVDSTLEELISLIRNDMYYISHGQYNYSQIENYNIFKKSLQNVDYLDGLFYRYYECVMDSNFSHLKEILKHEFFDKITEFENIEQLNDIHKEPVIERWKSNLEFLLENSKDYKAQQIEAQKIIGEEKKDKYLDLRDMSILYNHITPRLFYEFGYNVIIIKSSSYLLGISKSVTLSMIPDQRRLITEYDCNIGEKSELGLYPMSFFHPHGMKYNYQMKGPNKVILLNDDQDLLNERKHWIRKNYGQKIKGHYVEWFNGEKMLWDPNLLTNYVHSTDDACEASMHFLVGYPEYQVFTRFNYPNPVLMKRKK